MTVNDSPQPSASRFTPPSDPAEVDDWLRAREDELAAILRDGLLSIVGNAVARYVTGTALTAGAAMDALWQQVNKGAISVDEFTAQAHSAYWADQIDEMKLSGKIGDIAAFDSMAAEWSTLVVDHASIIGGMHASGAMSAWLGSTKASPIPFHVEEAFAVDMTDRIFAYQEQAVNRIVGATDDIWSTVRYDVSHAVATGQVGEQLKDRLEHDLVGISEQRADTIARTETVRAYNVGEYEGARRMRDAGFGPIEKVWSAAHDARTRPTHAAADGQVQAFDDPFQVGGVSMMHPHDQSAPAGETVNCRCALMLLYAGDYRPDGTIAGEDAIPEPAPPPVKPPKPAKPGKPAAITPEPAAPVGAPVTAKPAAPPPKPAKPKLPSTSRGAVPANDSSEFFFDWDDPTAESAPFGRWLTGQSGLDHIGSGSAEVKAKMNIQDRLTARLRGTSTFAPRDGRRLYAPTRYGDSNDAVWHNDPDHVWVRNGADRNQEWRRVEYTNDLSNARAAGADMDAAWQEFLSDKGSFGFAGVDVASPEALLTGRDGPVRVFARATDPAFIESVQSQNAANFIREWAVTSNDRNATALAAQEIADDLFGVGTAHPWTMTDDLAREVAAVRAEWGDDIAGFLQAQYDETQAMFAQFDTTHVKITRGFTWDVPDVPDWVPSEMLGTSYAAFSAQPTVSPTLRPMSSFSFNRYIAESFSKGDNFGVVIEGVVPVERIIGTARSGYGCLNEYEFVVLADDADRFIATRTR